MFRILGSELTTSSLARIGLNGVRRLGVRYSVELACAAIQSGRSYVGEHSDGWEVDHLWVPGPQHAGLSPNYPSGRFMPPVMAATMAGFGFGQ